MIILLGSYKGGCAICHRMTDRLSAMLAGAGGDVVLVDLAREVNEDLKAYAVLTMCPSNPAITETQDAQKQAIATAATGLACFIFRFLRRPQKYLQQVAGTLAKTLPFCVFDRAAHLCICRDRFADSSTRARYAFGGFFLT